MAPLYDIASIYAYPDLTDDKAKLAMKVGNKYRLREITAADWLKLAADLRVDPDRVVSRLRTISAQLPDHIADEARTMHASGLQHPIINRMVDSLSKRAGKFSAK